MPSNSYFKPEKVVSYEYSFSKISRVIEKVILFEYSFVSPGKYENFDVKTGMLKTFFVHTNVTKNDFIKKEAPVNFAKLLRASFL